MKVFNSKLAAIGLAAFVFASCSDSNSDPGTSPTNPEVVDAIDLGNVTSSAVVNYKNSTAKARQLLGTRAADETVFSGLTAMPSVPTEDLKQLNSAADLDGGSWIIDGNKSLDFTDKTIKNATIVVKSGSTLTYNQTGGHNNIYIEGNLVYTGTKSAVATGDQVAIYEHAGFESTNDITVDGNLYAQCPIGSLNKPDKNDASTWTPKQNVTINGGVYLKSYTYNDKNNKPVTVNASLRAKQLTINAGAKVNATDKISYTENLTLNGNLHVGTTLEVDNLTINNGGSLTADYSLKASKNLVMNDGASITTNYLNVTDNLYEKNGKEIIKVTPGNATATLNGACKIYIGANAVINTNNLVTDNTANQIVLKGANSTAVVKADKFTSKASGIVNAFSTPEDNQVFLIQFTASNIGGSDVNSFDDVDLGASYLDYDKATEGKELVAGANHTWQYNGKEVAAKQKLDLIANITSSNDGQSASCITPDGTKLYVTYHTQGDAFGGKVEVASVNGNQISIDQSVAPTITSGITSNTYSYDFNHVMKDGNALYVCGQSPVGAVLGSFVLSGGSISTADKMKTYNIDNKTPKNGYDANCVVKYKDNIIVAGTRGYEIFVPMTGFAHSYVASPGKAKHLAVSGSNLIGLNYKSDELESATTAVEGEIKIFTDAELKNSTSFNVGTIAPNNGKNTIAVDNTGNIYVCKSAKGLMAYDTTGNPLWSKEYVTPVSSGNKNNQVDKREGYINGVTVKDNYVYVAAGAYGVVVLNKADGTEVAHRAVGNLNSANYITVDNNNNIYVAYGKGRIRVFKLRATNN